jgi:putative thioredoxin
MTLQINEADFEREVIEASHEQPVLVDFWAPWCGPCRMVGPVLEKLVAEAGGRWRLVKINTDENQHLAAELRITGIPALKLYRDGGVAAELTGALPEREMRAWLEDHVPSAERVRLEAARSARAAGHNDEARKMAEELLANSADHREARLLLAELALPGDAEQARELLDGLAAGDYLDERIESMAQLAAFALRTDNGDGESAARYLEGARALRQGRFADAAEALLDVLRRDRALDDGARRTLVALFTWLGDGHEVTRSYRPRLASAMF